LRPRNSFKVDKAKDNCLEDLAAVSGDMEVVILGILRMTEQRANKDHSSIILANKRIQIDHVSDHA